MEPFAEWLSHLKQQQKKQKQDQLNRPSYPRKEDQEEEDDNPAARITDFLEHHFVRMSCGGVVLDMTKSLEDSEPLRSMQHVDDDLVKKYVQTWEDMGFLSRVAK